MRKGISITLGAIIISASIFSLNSQPVNKLTDKNKKADQLNQRINEAVWNAAMLGYNVGKNGGTPEETKQLIIKVFHGDTNALMEWAAEISKTNHTKILIVR